MAERQKSELQSIFEENILKSQGQNSVLNRMEDITERLQEKLDERDQIEEDTAPDEEIHDKEDQEKDKVHNQEAQEEMLEKNSNEDWILIYTNDSKAMEQHKVPENLKGRMLSAADIFKQNYAAFNPDTDSLSQILSRVKIS